MSKDFEERFGEPCDFTIKQQAKLFSEMVGLDKMSEIQRIEMRKSFYAGFNQAFMLFTNEIAHQTDDEAMDTLTNLTGELNEFLQEQREELEEQEKED